MSQHDARNTKIIFNPAKLHLTMFTVHP